MKNILVTGGAGFIGSNYITYHLNKNPTDKIFNLDILTYASNQEHLKEVLNNLPNHQFIQADICEYENILEIFKKHQITDVIHFAAESHVDNSINNPIIFTKTNVLGTHNLLEAARVTWGNNSSGNRFHHVSTDEVYGSLGETGYFTEKTAYDPSSPYSASKAGSDHIIKSYSRTFGMNITMSNCSNNFGPLQHDEKLIPTVIRKALAGEQIPIYGNGQNIRDWLFVQDHCSAIELVFSKGMSGETYNVGGDSEWNNLDLAGYICELLDELKPKATKYKDQISFVTDRLGHDFRYAINCSKISQDLNWSAGKGFSDGMKETVKWYIQQYE
jgi:dTDP-glucose 4,6-dehydratase